jgi:hypothetical protein
MLPISSNQDFDGIIGIFSGTALPANLSTNTGLLRITFSTDNSIQRAGWAAKYSATADSKVPLPDCADGARLVRAVLRTRQSASELSWTVARRTAPSAPTAPVQQLLASSKAQLQPVVMVGGLLPAALALSVPAAVRAAADGEYKDYRSYYSYACLPAGGYDLNLFDSYGDGWDGARLTLSELVHSPTTGRVVSECPVASDTVLQSTNTVAFEIKVRFLDE